jgi:acyl-coenzyme A thioesterase PaaI-like protein
MSTDHHRFMMTVNMTVQYRHPVPIGQELIAIGKVVRLNGRLGKAEGQIILADGTVACEAQLTLANMPAELADEARLGALDWRVDPD